MPAQFLAEPHAATSPAATNETSDQSMSALGSRSQQAEGQGRAQV